MIYIKKDGAWVKQSNIIASGTVTGNNLTLTLQDGDEITIDVSSLNEAEVTGVGLVGDTLTLTRSGATDLTTDLSQYDNKEISTVSLDGNNLVITMSDASQHSVNLSTLADGNTGNPVVSGQLTSDSNNLELTLADTSTVDIDVTELNYLPFPDYQIDDWRNRQLMAGYKLDTLGVVDEISGMNGVASNVIIENGTIGDVMTFNGTTSEVTIPTVSFERDYNFSVSLYAYLETPLADQTLLSINSATQDGVFEIVSTPANTIAFRIRLDGSPTVVREATFTNFPLQGYAHIAATYDGATMRLYSQGLLKTEISVIGALEGGWANITLGKAGDGSQRFNGKLALLRFFKKKLHTADVWNLFNEMTPTVYDVTFTGLNAYYRMGDYVEPTLPDSGPNGYHGTFTAGSSDNLQVVGGIAGSGLRYGRTAEQVTLPPGAFDASTPSWTVSIFCRHSHGGPNTDPFLINFKSGPNPQDPYLSMAINHHSLYVVQLVAGQPNEFTQSSTAPDIMADGEYHHFAIVKDGSAWTFYADGEVLSTYVEAIDVWLADTVVIGSPNGSSTTGENDIDQLRIYNSALTPGEVKILSWERIET